MTFSPAGSFLLRSGRCLQVTEFGQEDIYINVVEGVPCHLVNDRIIESKRLQAGSLSAHPPFMIEPAPTLLSNRRGDTGKFEPAQIPRIACRAHFRSTPMNRNPDDVSELVVLWFQEHYGWPTDPSDLSALRALDWEGLARDVGFF